MSDARTQRPTSTRLNQLDGGGGQGAKQKLHVTPALLRGLQGEVRQSWLKPAAEFIGYRAWLNSANSAQKGKWADAESYFIAGTPAYAAGMEASLMESSGGGGRHRKPTLMNKAGWLGGKIFGFPAGVVATGLDFYYTPAQSASQGPDAKIMAPKDPGRVHWK